MTVLGVPRLIDQTQRDGFAQNGFVLGGSLLPSDQAGVLAKVIADIVENQENELHGRVYDFKHGGRPLLHIKNMWKRHEAFRDLYRHPALVAALKDLTGRSSWHLWQDRFFYKPAQAGGFHTWHQDAKYLPFAPGYEAVSAWLALTDADCDNGAMSMVPGSHGWGDASSLMDAVADYAADGRPLPSTWEGHDIAPVMCPVPAGHVHFHSGSTWHASGPNWSDRVRCAIGFFFVSDETRFDAGHVYAGDYEGEGGQLLDPSIYPLVTTQS